MSTVTSYILTAILNRVAAGLSTEDDAETLREMVEQRQAERDMDRATWFLAGAMLVLIVVLMLGGLF